jgi:hypothetical protein
MNLQQKSFVNGLDLISPDTDIDPTGYSWLVNGRTRFGYVEPIPQPLLISNAPPGLKQGTISIGDFVIIFVAGKAYFKRYSENNWINITLFLMSTTATNIFSQAVPASTRDYTRQLNPSGSISDPVIIVNTAKTAGMPQCIVCQDGINQPWLIRFNEVSNGFTARILKTYDQWTILNPEYVPIGRQMFFMNQKLFIVSADETQVYHTVSGQPLNGMINVDSDGNKAATAALGDANTTAFAFDYDEITCIQDVNVANSFIYATKTTTRVLTLDYTNTIFGEPQITQAAKIDAGITNQYALTDINGDYAFVTGEGLRNFNAVQALQFQGRNSVFSKMVSKLFKNIRLSYAVAWSFDNYNLFCVNTVCGVIIAVYDSITAAWVALDFLNIGQIIQVSVIDLANEVMVYGVTADSVYLLYSLTQDPMQPYLFTRAFAAMEANQYINNPNTTSYVCEIKSQTIDLIFRDGSENGTVTCTEFVDGIEKLTLNRPITEADAVTPYEKLPTVQPLIEPEGTRVTFNFNTTQKGFKLGYAITWNTDAALMKIKLNTTDYNTETGDKQKQSTLRP